MAEKISNRKRRSETRYAKKEELKAIEARAFAKTQRIAPRKVRLVLNTIRGKSVQEAEAILSNLDKKSSEMVLKLIKSATANAEVNHGFDVNKLYVSQTYATEGPTLKRIRPRAKGSASAINKRTSHITVVVRER